MIFTRGEVLTSEFWVIDYEGTFEVDAYGLGDEWDGFYLWEMGFLGD